MTYLLDTNVVSEWVRPRPDAGVVAWLSTVDEDQVFLSVVTLAELRHGIERMAPGQRRSRLDSWLAVELQSRFESRILPVTDTIADTWGRIVARGERKGRPIGVVDAFLAATAHIHDLTLVTRNVADFRTHVGAILNPWTVPDP